MYTSATKPQAFFTQILPLKKEIGMVSLTSSRPFVSGPQDPLKVLCPSVSEGFMLYFIHLCSAPATVDGSPVMKQTNRAMCISLAKLLCAPSCCDVTQEVSHWL